MRVGTALYLGLLGATGAGRLAELRLSRRHERLLVASGATREQERSLRWIVLLHTAVLAGSALEVLVLRRRLRLRLAGAMAVPFLLANTLRWWVIRTMGVHWNVRVLDSAHLGVVSSGPFRWLRHPNYLALFVELEALPLMHGAWLTALAGGIAHVCVLGRRVRAEEAVLMRNADYRALMGAKPCFLPRLRRR
jgi:methyltransferase